MLLRITQWLSGVHQYVIAGMAGTILLLTVGIYIEHLRNAAQKGKLDVVTARLTLSNQSIKDLKGSLVDVYQQLSDAQEAEQRQKDRTAEALAKVREQNKGLVSLQHRLETRPSQSRCPIPKELSDAWSIL